MPGASRLLGIQKKKTGDVFCAVRCRGDTQHTRVEKDVSSSAVFYERFTFDIPSKSSSKACFVVIDIKEKGLFRSHSIGKCTIGSISPFEGDAQKPKWFTITDRKNADTGAQLKVCAQYVFLPDHKRSRGESFGRMARKSVTAMTGGRGLTYLPIARHGSDMSLLSNSDTPRAMSGSVSSEGEDMSSDGEEDAGEEALTSKAVEEEEKKRKEQQEAFLKRIEEMPIKHGNWRAIVHVIEVRDLNPEDLQGTCDPVVRVKAGSDVVGYQNYSTKVRKQTTSCTFDDTFFFTFKEIGRDELESIGINIQVFDADLFTRNDMIGSYLFDALDVYFQPNHKYNSQWVGLLDQNSKGDFGVQGYLRVSVTLLGPGDVDVIETGSEENGEVDEMTVLMPPSIKMDLRFFRIRFYNAENLPNLDPNFLTRGGGIDPYFRVNFNALNAKTRRKKIRGKVKSRGFGTVFNEEIWLPIYLQGSSCLTKYATIALWDHDFPGLDDLVGRVKVNYADILKMPRGRLPPRWYNFYGPPNYAKGDKKSGSKAVALMKKDPTMASAFRGRVLLEFADYDAKEDNSEKDVVHKKRIKPLMKHRLPATAKYILKAHIFSGNEMPRLKKFMGIIKDEKTPLSVSISCGIHEAKTGLAKCGKGIAKWNEALELELDLPRELLDRWQAPEIQRMVEMYDEAKINLEVATMKAKDTDLRRLAVEENRQYSDEDTDDDNDDDDEANAARNRRRSVLDNTSGSTESFDSSSIVRVKKLKRVTKRLHDEIIKALDDNQVPDVFLYVNTKSGTKVSFARWKAAELILGRCKNVASWQMLREEKCANLLDDDDFAGTVLASLAFGSEDMMRKNWEASRDCEMGGVEDKKYTVRVNVYQGVDLPSADPDGTLDPYVYVYCCGERKRVSTRFNTCDPLFYETVEFHVSLPPAELAPSVSLRVMDHDDGLDSDDYIGTARIPLADIAAQSAGSSGYSATAFPTWYSLSRVIPGDTEGALLLSVQIYSDEATPAPAIRYVSVPKVNLTRTASRLR